MSKFRLLIFFCLPFVFYINGYADTGLIFRHLTRNEGLLHDNVTCIAQDSIGYIWFGTHRGLNRFDGYLIDSYRYDNGKINSVYYNRIYSIEIIDRFLWMATEAGIACFDIRKKQYIDVVAKDSDSESFYLQVRTLKRGNGGLLWFFTDRDRIRLGEVSYDSVKNQCIITTRKIGNDTEYVSPDFYPKLACDKSGNVWISGKDRLSCYSRGSDGELYFAGYSEQTSGHYIKEMRCDNSALWVAYWDKLIKYNVLNITTLEPVQTIPYSWRNVLTFYMNDNFVWLGSDLGILQIDKKGNPPTPAEYRHSPLDADSPGNDPDNIFLDRDNNLWVAAWGVGVSYANTTPKLFRTINSKSFK